MEFPAQVECLGDLGGLDRELHLAIGIFDGVHLGHKTVIESAVFSARRSGGVSGVLTFHPHPSRLFRPDDPKLLIMPLEEKVALLHEVGVDVVITKTFDRDFAAVEATDFLAHLRERMPRLSSVFVGENFRFGRKRAGDVDLLVETGRELGVDVFSVSRIRHNGEPISSTRIRDALTVGEIRHANDMLGYNYFARGEVEPGEKRGRRIGFPTLNLPWNPECRPAFGVYFTRVRGRGTGRWRYGVANYGVRPTVENEAPAPRLEVHVLGETELGVGSSVVVEWLRFIRPEWKFDSVDALREQIGEDREAALRMAGDG